MDKARKIGYNSCTGRCGRVSNAKWKKNTAIYAVRFTYTSGIPAIIDKASKEIGIPANTTARQAILEKLQREGYLPSENSSGEKSSDVKEE